ncbi:MAG: S8 family serine peptidase [Actinomycetota bacterium]
MKRVIVLLTALATALALAIPAIADPHPVQPSEPVPDSGPGEFVNELPSLWFVELEERPTSQGGNAATIAQQQRAFKAEARSAGLDVEERFAFSALWNGLSVEVGPGDAGKLRTLDGVVATYPVATVGIPETQSGSPDLATALAMTGADVAQSELGLTGQGVRVAVMDTGIDYDHPDLGAGFGPGSRVETGWDFVGDDFNADPTSDDYNPVPDPDPDPDDCNGHGTHVAGIVGADGASGASGAIGVAPEVTFGAYRVFGCEGSTTADIMIAAMEMALEDDMDILNMSIGSAYMWPGYPTATASDNLVDEGMVVVASIGNSGATGTFSAGAPGLGEKVIGVASFDNTNVQLKTFTYDDPNTEEDDAIQVGYATMSGAEDPPTEGSEEVVHVGRGCSFENVEDTPDVPEGGDEYLADPDGAVALIERGACTFRNKAERARDAGATAAIIYNSSPGNFSGTVGTPPMDFPVVSISQADGQAIVEVIDDSEDPVEITWTDEEALFPNPTGGLISSFSSYGLAPDLSVKPDIGAPGGSIRSTWPIELGSYATISGTSMASPHVAGGAALLLEARPATGTEDVRDIFQNSADPAVWSLNPGLGFLDQVYRQGAGMLDIDDAILSTTTVSPGKIALGETGEDPISRSFTVHNSSSESITYALGLDIPSVSTIGTFPDELGFYVGGELVDMPDDVTVPAGGKATVEVKFTAVPNVHVLDGGLFSGYITLTPDEGESLRVPYAGFGGDYQQLTVLSPSPEGLPAIGHPVEESNLEEFVLVDEGHVFTMEGENVPHALIHHHHQASAMTIDIYSADTDEPVHPVFSTAVDQTLLQRNSTEDAFFAWEWNGERFHSQGAAKVKTKQVPDGDYYLVVTVLKALGDPDNPDHVETWTSPTFTIDRPDDSPGKSGGNRPVN